MVAEKLAKAITQTKAGLSLAVESWTLERYADHWKKDNVSARLRLSTVSSYRETLRLHVLSILGHTTLRALTPTQVQALLATKTAAGLSCRSVRIVHETLRSMLGEAVRDELVERNVATVVRAPSVPQQEVQPWSTDEAAKFLRASSQHRLHGLFAVGVALGKDELLALHWQEVDLDEDTIRVRQTVQPTALREAATAMDRALGQRP